MRSTSVDRYNDYTDRKYEEDLIKQQVSLRQQILAQHQNNHNIQNVLMGLAAVRMLLDTAQGTEGDAAQAQLPQATGAQADGAEAANVQFQAALQAEQFLQIAQQQIANIMGSAPNPQPAVEVNEMAIQTENVHEIAVQTDDV